MKQVRGFTLLELMVTMVILVIIAAFAAPSFNNLMRNTRIDSNTSKIRTALTYARSEAVNLGSTVTVCSSTDLLNCNGDQQWETGWIVFSDLDSDGAFDGPTTTPCVTGNDCVLRVSGALPEDAVLLETNGERFVTFTAQGAVVPNASMAFSLALTMPNCAVGEMRTLNLNLIGRLTVTTGNCP
ncbi:GspH/FimT family pseudopilin [Reinekea sp.]|uniref:GspH/FimT family pseudopilin n=1 Tax=Reinekea sp. TaxID=1970455 RepID=UPI002A7EE1DE|nr:GspH/FimT family pseudopilin [Reinekea sp.]